MDRPSSVSRRTLMAGGAALSTLAALDPIRIARAAQALPPRSGPTLDDEDFMALSRALTGHVDLDPGLGDALLAAFDDNGRADDLAGLHEAMRAAAGDPGAVAALLTAPDSAAMAHAVLRGWYVGLVATSDGDIRVGYEETLMGVVVDDFLQLRSNCGGEPHFWAQPPELSDLAVEDPS